jgi:diacylglycerol kinase (ATP)
MYYYIINPSSGGGKINKVQDKLRARLKELGIAGEFVKSTGPGDIPKLTKMAIEKGYNTIVAVGGDGTINEVINSLPDESVALGIIPMGNTNELATLLGINDWNDACTILAARKVEIVDLGKIGDKIFVTSVAIGFDSVLYDLKKYQSDD